MTIRAEEWSSPPAPGSAEWRGGADGSRTAGQGGDRHGGSDGLGLATARRLAAEGAAVAICGRAETRLEEATAALRASGAAILDMAADVTRAEDLDQLVSSTLERFGRVAINFDGGHSAVV